MNDVMESRSPLVDLAALLASFAVVPGGALVVLGWRAVTAENDMLMPVIGMMGFAAAGVGLALGTWALVVAVRLARRLPDGRLPALALGITGAAFGLMVSAIGGGWPWLVVAWGGSLVAIMLTPAAGRELGPLLVWPRRPTRRRP